LDKNSFESKAEFGCVIESNAGSDGINETLKASFYLIIHRTLLKELIRERARRDLDKNSFESNSARLLC
jgi:hypothetical protein